MSVILLLLGILITAAGIAAIGFGIPINELPLGSTLIIAGSTGLAGGLILFGLSAAVSELARIAEALRPRSRAVTRPAEAAVTVNSMVAAPAPATAPSAGPRPAVRAPQPVPEAPRVEALRAEAPRAEAPRPAAAPAPSAVEVSSAAIERLRSSIPRAERPRAEPSVMAEEDDVPLSPNGAAHYPQPRPSNPEPPAEPRVTAEDRVGDAPVDAVKRSRLDFLFRSRSARAAPQTENFDAVWQSDGAAAKNPGAEAELPVDRSQVPPAAQIAAAAEQRRAEPQPAPAEQRSTAAILKSGVVDGMAYTLYADGSIEAKLPQGTVRFGSIAELRAHIESNS